MLIGGQNPADRDAIGQLISVVESSEKKCLLRGFFFFPSSATDGLKEKNPPLEGRLGPESICDLTKIASDTLSRKNETRPKISLLVDMASLEPAVKKGRNSGQSQSAHPPIRFWPLVKTGGR